MKRSLLLAALLGSSLLCAPALACTTNDISLIGGGCIPQTSSWYFYPDRLTATQLWATSSSPSQGQSAIQPGSPTNSGITAFYFPSGARSGYIGGSTATGYQQLETEGGSPGYEVSGVLKIDGGAAPASGPELSFGTAMVGTSGEANVLRLYDTGVATSSYGFGISSGQLNIISGGLTSFYDNAHNWLTADQNASINIGLNGSPSGTKVAGGFFVDPTLAGVQNGLAVGAAATPHVTTSGGFTTDYGREFYVVRQQPNIPGPQPNGASWVFANGGVGMITNDSGYTPASVVGVGGFYDTLSVVQHDTGATSGDSSHPYPAGTNYGSNGIGVYQDIGNNASHLSGANAVGISEFSICHFAGRCWGENPSMSSDASSTGLIWGVEVDINNASDHETGYGITVAGASSSAGTGFPGFAVNFMDQGAAALPSGYNPYQWSYGMLINQGTSAVGLRIGSTDYRTAPNGPGGAIVPNAYSQSIELGWNDATTAHTMSIAAINNGAFAISNTSGAAPSIELNGLQGLTYTATVRNAAGTGTCVIQFNGGIITSTSC